MKHENGAIDMTGSPSSCENLQFRERNKLLPIFTWRHGGHVGVLLINKRILIISFVLDTNMAAISDCLLCLLRLCENQEYIRASYVVFRFKFKFKFIYHNKNILQKPHPQVAMLI